MIKEKKYYLYYFRHRDLLHPIVLPTIIELEYVLKQLPPIVVAKQEFLEYEHNLRSLAKYLAGYSYYISLESIKTGFPENNFYITYSKKEREEIGEYIFSQQELYFLNFIAHSFKQYVKPISPTINNYVKKDIEKRALSIYKELIEKTFMMAFSINIFEK